MDPETITEPSSPTPLMREHELLKDATPHTYKVTEEGELKAHVFYPDGFKSTDQRPTAVFFHGGKWDKQMVSQFVPQAIHLVAYGAIAVLVEYRVSSLYESDHTPVQSISDAQSAILWLRENHQFLGVDPHKISAWGAGSGAHIALCAAMNPDVENNGLFDSRPQNLVLFSAIVDTSKAGVGFDLFPDKKAALYNSPIRNIRRKLPPSIFYHGSADSTTPVATVEKFCKKMRSKKNTCLFYPVTRGTHSFFNFNVNEQNFIQSLDSAVGFLRELGFLDTDEDLML